MLKNFTEKIKWMDWKATLINFLKCQPGMSGVPLNYVISNNVAAIVQTNMNFIDDYIDRTPLTGSVFDADESKLDFQIA